MVTLKSKQEIDYIQKAGEVAALVHRELEKYISKDITTKELDEIAESVILQHGCRPAFKGYRGFPSTLTVSINEEVVHGIPRKKRKIKEGDIVSIDVGVIFKDYYADMAITYPVGEIDDCKRRLLEITKQSLYEGINQAIEGNHLTDISHAIQKHVEINGFSIVRELVGHGIGKQLHEDPPVPNYGPPGMGILLKAGMVLAIEPMVNAGGYKVRVKKDQWTVITVDKSPSAHFEHTVAITTNGPVILTRL